MTDPFPLVLRRSSHVGEPLAKLLAKKGIATRAPLTAGWPPADWESDDLPSDDTGAAIRQWFDYFIGLLPAWESAWRDKRRDGTGPAGRVVRDAYRLVRHLRDQGRTQAEDDERPSATYSMHDALLILRRLRDSLFPAPAADESQHGEAPPAALSEDYIAAISGKAQRTLLRAVNGKGLVPIEDVLKAVYGSKNKDKLGALLKAKDRINVRLNTDGQQFELHCQGERLVLSRL